MAFCETVDAGMTLGPATDCVPADKLFPVKEVKPLPVTLVPVKLLPARLVPERLVRLFLVKSFPLRLVLCKALPVRLFTGRLVDSELPRLVPTKPFAASPEPVKLFPVNSVKLEPKFSCKAFCWSETRALTFDAVCEVIELCREEF